MNKPEIDVHIHYRSKPDADTPYVRLPSVPRVGEIIIVSRGARYRVAEVIYDDSSQDATRIIVEVDPT